MHDPSPRSRHSLLLDLLDRWYLLQKQGQPASAAEVCADCPELAGELEQLALAARRAEQAARPEARTPAPVAQKGQATLPLADGPGMLRAPAGARYRVEDKLGEGGMGAVYRARDEALGRTVALKVIRPETLTAAMRVRFEAEAKAVAALDHPNIIKIYDIGEWPGEGGPSSPCLALEYVGGGTLTKLLEAGPLPVASAAHLVGQLAGAVAHAHARGVVHRDLKPDNVLLSPTVRARSVSDGLAAPPPVANAPGSDLVPKITDFGLARQVHADQRLTRGGAIVGTPAYMAPEQADGLPDVGPPADVYALGGILYRLLAGRPPFESDSVVDLLYRVCREAPPPFRRHRANVPAALEAICLDCLAKQPAARPTATQLADRLEAFLKGEMREIHWAKRPSRRRLLLAGLAAAAAGVGGVAWLSRQGEVHPLPPLRITALRAYHLVAEGKGHAEEGYLGERANIARVGDGVRLTVELSSPGYFYLIGFNFDGKEQLLWPGKVTESPAILASLTFPSGGDNILSLDDDDTGGTQAFVVAASSHPLPAFAQWRKGRTGITWEKRPACLRVWAADDKGCSPVLGPDRGVVKKIEGAPPLRELCAALLGNGVEAVRAVAFGVLPKEGGR